MNIIGLNESLGIPYRYQKKVKSMHDHIIEGVYQNLKKDVSYYINDFSMFFNKTHHIRDSFSHNLTIKEIKLLIQYGNEAARNNFFTKLFIPKSLSNLNPITDVDDKKIVDVLKEDDNIILYASGVNDIMYDLNACFYNVTFNSKRRKEALLQLDKNLIQKTLEKIEDNFKMFLSINPRTTLFVFNFSIELYCPNFIYPFAKNWKSMKILLQFVEQYNEALKQLAEKYHFIYIDNRKQYNIKERTRKIIECISNTKVSKQENSFAFSYDDLGLNGFLEEQKKWITFYQKQEKSKRNEEKIKEHLLDVSIVQKIMEDI